MKQISNFRICTRCDTFVIRRYWIRTKDCTFKEETMVGSWADRSTSVQEWSSGEGETDGGFRKWKLNSSHDGIQTFILIIEKKIYLPKTHVVCLKKTGEGWNGNDHLLVGKVETQTSVFHCAIVIW